MRLIGLALTRLFELSDLPTTLADDAGGVGSIRASDRPRVPRLPSDRLETRPARGRAGSLGLSKDRKTEEHCGYDNLQVGFELRNLPAPWELRTKRGWRVE